ncbi:MAG: hypothetical protein QGH47_00065, partial [Candidatus Woesearchaeota archaeon]|nr:hypothetical protein [Candidatus Woesearchaeota archaeon]
MKKLKIIAIWMMFLIVTLPFYSSSVFAQFNGNSKFNESMDLDDLRTKYGVRGVKGIDIDKACFEKNAEDQGIIEVMNNQVVHIIESIFLILYLINTVINAIDLVYRTVGLIIGYISQPCFGFFFFGPWGGAACAFNEANVRGFEIGFFANDIVSCLISCPCTENSKCP